MLKEVGRKSDSGALLSTFAPPFSSIPRPPASYGGEGQFKVFQCPSAPPMNPSSTVIQAVTPPGVSGTDWNSAWGAAGNGAGVGEVTRV